MFFFILIYVLYKSKSLTLELWLYSWIYVVMSIGLWAQVAVFTHVIDVGTGLFLGRAPRTMETLPDFRERGRVTRHSQVFPWVDWQSTDPRDLGRH